MDGSRFDELTKRLAGAEKVPRPSRRALLKGLFGGALGLLGAGAGERGAMAAPAIVLTPISGPVRTRVQVKLAGFSGFEPFEVRWFNGTAYQVVVSNTVTRSGIRTVSFSVPNTYRGTHSVRAVGALGSVATAAFRVKQSVTLSQAEGTRGASVRATLRGFKAGVAVELRFFASTSTSSAVTVLGTTTGSRTGTGTITATIPARAALGAHRVEARERSSGALAAAAFTVRCGVPADCGSDLPCRKRTCIEGVCGRTDLPAGTAIATQTPGDCKRLVCNGAGGFGPVIDDTDLPVAPGQCLTAICTGGIKSFPPREAGTPCAEHGGTVCDGAGVCVACLEDADCAAGTCVDPAACDDGNACTGAVCNPASGCEQSPLPAWTPCDQDGGSHCDGAGRCIVPFCVPGATEACYSGPVGTLGVGICAAGTRSCNAEGAAWGPCDGEVLPGIETCNGRDDDCDGAVDNGVSCPGGEHASGMCVEGACVLTCDPGWAQCPGDSGCTTRITDDPANCGGCGIPCSPFEVCLNSVCQPPPG